MKRPTSSIEFLDNLIDLLCEPDPYETTEMLKERLRADGIDVEGTLRRTEMLLKKYGIDKKLT